MLQLKAVAVEDGALIATAPDGTQYRIAVDENVRAQLRGAPAASAAGRRSTPREIQTYIRGGMSAIEVAGYTGESLDYVQRYERPILAERQYMVESAMAVPVVLAPSSDQPEGETSTFGAVLEERFAQLTATGVRWSSWKEPDGGWVLKATFTADGIEHDARWSFDVKRPALSPLNGEALALSQRSEIGATLLPRLRAVPSEQRMPDASRFDSAAFAFPADVVEEDESAPQADEPAPATGRVRIPARTGTIGVLREPVAPEPAATADLLDALRRRRGERESATFEDAPRDQAETQPRTGKLSVLERVRSETPRVPETTAPDAMETTPAPRITPSPANQPTGPVPRTRRPRSSMPSWDEIVFGARPEDDPTGA